MSNRKPQTLSELFEFYYEYVKPLYAHLSSLNAPPLEMLFEINAAFDHLSRYWKYGQNEQEIVNSVSGHLKRGCFDAFKIVVRDTIEDYKELRKVDISIIDNGDFDRDVRKLISEIRTGAQNARLVEGDSRDEHTWHNAFEAWVIVYANCKRFKEEFYLSDKVLWAKRKETWQNWKRRFEGIIIGIVAGAILWGIMSLLGYWR